MNGTDVDAREAALGLLGLSPSNNILPVKRKHHTTSTLRPSPPPPQSVSTHRTTSPPSRSNNNLHPPPLPSQSPPDDSTPATIDTESINCICSLSYDDGFSIACDSCSRWCHAACFSIQSPAEVPETWYCWVCHGLGESQVEEMREKGMQIQLGKEKERRSTARDGMGTGGGRGGGRVRVRGEGGGGGGGRKKSPGVERNGKRRFSTATGGVDGHAAPKRKRRLSINTTCSVQPHPTGSAVATPLDREDEHVDIDFPSSHGNNNNATITTSTSTNSKHPPNKNWGSAITETPDPETQPWTQTYIPITKDIVPHHDTQDKLRRQARAWRGVTALVQQPHEVFTHGNIPTHRFSQSPAPLVHPGQVLSPFDQTPLMYPGSSLPQTPVVTVRPLPLPIPVGYGTTPTSAHPSNSINSYFPNLGNGVHPHQHPQSPFPSSNFHAQTPSTPHPHPNSINRPASPTNPHALRPPAYALHTTAPIPSASLIAPYRSTIVPSSVYLGDVLNGWAHLGTPKPHVHILGPPLDIVLDSRLTGNEGRWVRSGCWPNAVIRPVVCGGRGERVKRKEGGGEGARDVENGRRESDGGPKEKQPGDEGNGDVEMTDLDRKVEKEKEGGVKRKKKRKDGVNGGEDHLVNGVDPGRTSGDQTSRRESGEHPLRPLSASSNHPTYAQSNQQKTGSSPSHQPNVAGSSQPPRTESRSPSPSLEFALFALRDLKAGEEVVLGWEWDDGSVVHCLPGIFGGGVGPHQLPFLRAQMTSMLHTLSSSFTTCACGERARDCVLKRMEEFVDGPDPIPQSPRPHHATQEREDVTESSEDDSSRVGARRNGKQNGTGQKNQKGGVDLGPLVGVERGFRTREKVPWSGGMSGVEMVQSPAHASGSRSRPGYEGAENVERERSERSSSVAEVARAFRAGQQKEKRTVSAPAPVVNGKGKGKDRVGGEEEDVEVVSGNGNGTRGVLKCEWFRLHLL
ncbi:hypothetical protein JAAARDRAFT_605198 [Jaapia argillacea MUCL 33604]|uniref:PHD-type domain-containing protein n=1 Tax=Jaapia argillacea MUCL 33604 TaxID=933084 RepID=A0A067Q0A4_9AGAM|nr:hypothetical protein JAAARDRAFT_605198 [Jaapia argillacea MUCL 33604]